MPYVSDSSLQTARAELVAARERLEEEERTALEVKELQDRVEREAAQRLEEEQKRIDDEYVGSSLGHDCCAKPPMQETC